MLKCNIRELMAIDRINSITELMEDSGLSRNTLNKLYHEKDIGSIKLETLMALCDCFNCALSELIEYEP